MDDNIWNVIAKKKELHQKYMTGPLTKQTSYIERDTEVNRNVQRLILGQCRQEIVRYY